MPRRLLRDPHLLAHVLRTPLCVLAGWFSMMQDGEVDPVRTPDSWRMAVAACQRSIEQLNLIIRETCDEVAAQAPEISGERYQTLLESTRQSITRAQDVMEAVRRRRES